MDAREQKRIGVVGRNIYSAYLLEQLKKFPHLSLHSFYAENEKLRDHPNFVFWPQKLPLNLEAKTFGDQGPLIFFEGTRRLPFKDYQHYLLQKKSIPQALVNKIEGLLFWNDRSPYVADPDEGPQFDWVKHRPFSLSQNQQAQPCIADLRSVLPQLFSESYLSGVQFHEAAVIHLNSIRGSGSSLVLEAPHAMMPMDRVLWASYGNSLRIEGHSQALVFPKPNFVWRSYGAYVSRELVTALPEFSFWVDCKNSEEFFYTGLYRWGLFRRVFVDRSHEKVWLQVDDLQQQGQPLSERPDSCLWRLCPYLQEEKIKFKDWISAENNFFIHPEPQSEALAPSIFSAFPGFFQTSIDKWISQWKLAAPVMKKKSNQDSTSSAS